MELLGNFSFVKVQPITGEKVLLLSEIKEAVDIVNLVKKGELQSRPAKELLNEILMYFLYCHSIRQLKRLEKKFPSLKAEYAALVEELEENLEKGTSWV